MQIAKPQKQRHATMTEVGAYRRGRETLRTTSLVGPDPLQMVYVWELLGDEGKPEVIVAFLGVSWGTRRGWYVEKDRSFTQVTGSIKRALTLMKKECDRVDSTGRKAANQEDGIEILPPTKVWFSGAFRRVARA